MLATAIFTLLFVPEVRGEIIDRIAVSVGNRVITASALEREIRVTAFLNGGALDLSAANRRRTAERMVDQRLVRRELELSRYPTPAPSEVEPLLARLKSGDFAARLARYGISEQDVREALLWQLTFLRFIDVRFRPAVQVSFREIRAYFETVVRPAAQAAQPNRTPTLSEYREQIEKKLAGERIDRELETWLQESRKRVAIEYREEVFR